ncbi:PAS domain S-box protein [Candidatus Parcubacteria bacterium]|nr:PAS domain S-box protein [Candidatus Parcubacteria bacterium]
MDSKNSKIHSASVASAEFERERLMSLINSMGDAVIAVDETAKIVLYNAAALSIFDTNKSLVGLSINDVMKIIDKNNQPIDFNEYILSCRTQQSNREFRFKYPDETSINIYISVAPVKLGWGKSGRQGYVILMRDITREKSLEEERDEFISVISHELRTPIAISEGEVSNALYLAEKIGANQQVTDAINAAHEQILFLSEMVNDLATLSRAERGKLEVEIEKINIHDLLEELRTDYEPQAGEKGLKLNIKVDSDVSMLSSSKLYVREILQNFITNAIKYTEAGSVSVSAHKNESGIRFEVSDTGIGISKPDQQKVFDKFFRSEDYRTKASSGSGLGLYVTLKLARLIHAEIDIKSELNEGSTFIIDIPDLK